MRLLDPDDIHNRTLVANVHPPEWVNPTPDGPYNLVVIGAGTAGLVTAAIAAGLGARVALIEKHLMGGDCLNVGCVPSKSLLRAARAWADVRRAGEFGVRATGPLDGDFAAAMERMRRLRARISHADSAYRFKSLGVDVYIGDARFSGRDAVEVAGRTLVFTRAAICTGGRAAAPPIPGLEEVGYLTNETIFSLTERPARLAVIGAGPIGCELAQAFARFGSRVTVLEQLDRILPREDADAAAVVQGQMARDGVTFVLKASIVRAERRGGENVLIYDDAGHRRELAGVEILVGVGRAPNVEGLNLEAAGVAYDRQGVRVNGRLQTRNPRIYAAGDICSPHKFTHTADALAQIVIQNALFPHPFGLAVATTDTLIVPWCTYTEPAVAHVGLYEAEARARGIDVDTFTSPMNEVDRAILDGEDGGFARVHVERGTDRILGATIVAADAGNIISEVGVAMQAGAGLGTIGRTIHPYPTQAEVLKKLANTMRTARFSERQKSILRRWFKWMRS